MTPNSQHGSAGSNRGRDADLDREVASSLDGINLQEISRANTG